jgi:hypothetical protein
MQQVDNLSEDFLAAKLKQHTGFKAIENINQDCFEVDSSYLKLKIGNTDQCQLRIKNKNLSDCFLSILPSNEPKNINEPNLRRLRNYLIMREIFLNLAGARYDKSNKEDMIARRKWHNVLKSALDPQDVKRDFDIDLNALMEVIDL